MGILTAIAAIAAVLYFLPTIIAALRGRQTGSVLVVNLLLGWTLVGWAAALAVALSNKPQSGSPPAGLPSVAGTPVIGNNMRMNNARAHASATVPPPDDPARIATVRPHWCALRHDLTYTLASTALAFAATFAIRTGIVSTLFWYCALFMILRLAWKIYSWHGSTVVFTATRIYLSPGPSRRNSEVLFLAPGSEVFIATTPVGDVLGYGNLMVWAIGTYGPTAIGVADLPDPAALCAALQHARQFDAL